MSDILDGSRLTEFASRTFENYPETFGPVHVVRPAHLAIEGKGGLTDEVQGHLVYVGLQDLGGITRTGQLPERLNRAASEVSGLLVTPDENPHRTIHKRTAANVRWTGKATLPSLVIVDMSAEPDEQALEVRVFPTLWNAEKEAAQDRKIYEEWKKNRLAAGESTNPAFYDGRNPYETTSTLIDINAGLRTSNKEQPRLHAPARDVLVGVLALATVATGLIGFLGNRGEKGQSFEDLTRTGTEIDGSTVVTDVQHLPLGGGGNLLIVRDSDGKPCLATVEEHRDDGHSIDPGRTPEVELHLVADCDDETLSGFIDRATHGDFEVSDDGGH